MRTKEAPNISWTSLIGSSPGRMLSGRQSHVNQKSKEVWFYENLPVLTSIDWFIWQKFATERGIRDAYVAVSQFSLNLNVRNILIGVLMYTKYAHGQLHFSEKGTSVFSNTLKKNCTTCTLESNMYACSNMHRSNEKKWEESSGRKQWYLRTMLNPSTSKSSPGSSYAKAYWT